MKFNDLQEAGGLLSLAEGYCRINRARGLVLVSPEDLLKACKTLGPDRKLQLYLFPTGVYALQSKDLETGSLDNETLTTVSIAQLYCFHGGFQNYFHGGLPVLSKVFGKTTYRSYYA